MGVDVAEVTAFFTNLRLQHPRLFTYHYQFSDKHSLHMPIEYVNTFIQPHLYQIPLAYQKEVNETLDKLLAYGVIVPSSSATSSPVLCVPKSDGTLRICVDFRAVNKATKPDKYALPRIDEIKQKIKGNYFSVIDLKDGFYHIPILPIDQDKTTIHIHRGSFKYVRMPFGLRNAPSNFQRLMDVVLFGLKNTMPYIDDVIIFSDTIEEHLHLLDAFFERAIEYDFMLNWKKSKFFQSSVTYLGLQFDSNGYCPKKEVYPKVEKFPVPKDKKGILKFMGLINYYKDHISQLAEIAAPLFDLTHKHVRFHWKPECQVAFDNLKMQLKNCIKLTPINYELPFELYCDASDVAIGACLVQDNKPVLFFSKKLNETQQRYSVTKREAYAMVMSILQFKYYLIGNHFTVFTDHKPLEAWYSMEDELHAKWMCKLDGLSFDVIYVENV